MNRRDLLKSAVLPLFALPAAPAPGQAPRFRSALCAYSYRDELAKKTMTYSDLVNLAAEAGVDGLDATVYWFPDTSDSFLIPLRALAYRNAVEIYSISIRTEMTRATAQERAAETAAIHKWIDVAVKLGAGHIRVFGGRVPKGSTEDQAAMWCAETLKPAAEYAAKHGVILGLENHGGITATAARILEIVRKVDSPAVGINLDTGNFEKNAWAQIEMLAPQAVNVQVKAEVRDDSGNRVPGDWPRVIGILKKAGYRGYLALEYEEKDAPANVPRLLRKLDGLTRNA
jgi:sugar phosphate isomerase/epimerase